MFYVQNISCMESSIAEKGGFLKTVFYFEELIRNSSDRSAHLLPEFATCEKYFIKYFFILQGFPCFFSNFHV